MLPSLWTGSCWGIGWKRKPTSWASWACSRARGVSWEPSGEKSSWRSFPRSHSAHFACPPFTCFAHWIFFALTNIFCPIPQLGACSQATCYPLNHPKGKSTSNFLLQVYQYVQWWFHTCIILYTVRWLQENCLGLLAFKNVLEERKSLEPL